MATDKAPYELSRAALRERYGSRRINASAPQSARDFTPSGRLRYLEGQGLSPSQATARSGQMFSQMFNGAPATPNMTVPQGRPIGVPQMGNPLQKQQQGNQQFIANSTFEPATLNAPTMGGLSFDMNAPSLLPAPTLASYMPSNPTAYTPSWLRRKAAPYAGAVLASANRWLT